MGVLSEAPTRCAAGQSRQPIDQARARSNCQSRWARWRSRSSVVVETARSGRVDVGAYMGRNCCGGNCCVGSMASGGWLSAMRLISASTPTPDCPDGLDQPSAAQLGRSPRAATSRADGVSGRSTRRQAHWSAARIHSPPKMPAGTGAVAFRSVFAFVVLQTCNKPHSPHFRAGFPARINRKFKF